MRCPAPAARVLALLLAVMLLAAQRLEAQIRLDYVPGELLVKRRVVRGVTPVPLSSSIVSSTLTRFDFIGVEHLRLQSGVAVEEAIRQLQRDPTVEYAEPNYIVHAVASPDDSLFGELWGLSNTGQGNGTAGADIGALQAWDVTTGDPEIKIGVIDTGVDYRHPDLVDNMWTNEAEANGFRDVDDDGNGYVDDIHGYDFAYDDGDPFDDHFHGTHCAGTIAARGNNRIGVTGVNWRAKIVAIKFLDVGGSGTNADAIEAIQYAIAVGCRLTSNSWGGGAPSQAMLDAISAAGSAGQLFIAAAGNNFSDNDEYPFYPASYSWPNIVSVAATDRSNEKAGFSNWGRLSVHLGAPGVSILSTLPANSYGLLNGTSMATPHVAGVAALVWSRFPWLGPAEVKTVLMQTVTPTAALASRTISGGMVHAGRAVRGIDALRPAAITDLSVVEAGSTSVILEWTASGDDGSSGVARFYELRGSPAPIDESNFEAAIAFPAPLPKAAGASERWVVPGLSVSTEYYFAIRAVDRFLNKGLVSNLAHVTTLPAPSLSLSRTSVSLSSFTGDRRVETITLTNPSSGLLEFSLHAPELLAIVARGEDQRAPAGAATEGIGAPTVPKGAVDSAPGLPVTDARGGPDAYGYRWIDELDPVGPDFTWIDIASPAHLVLSAGDDVASAALPLGFEFPYYGQRVAQAFVSSNGFLSFTSADAPYANRPFPTPEGVTDMIAPLWDDLVIGGGRVYARAEPARFVVSWVGVERFPSGGPYTFQAILESTGEIRFQYQQLSGLQPSATVGIQNGARSIGLNVTSNAPYLQELRAVRIRPLPEWLSVSTLTARIPPGGSQDLTLVIETARMNGDYDAILAFDSNAPAAPHTVIPIHVGVIGAGDVAAADAIDLGEVVIGQVARETLLVGNDGVVPLHVSQVGFTGDGVTVEGATSFVVGPGATHDVVVRWTPSATGALAGSVALASDDPDESPLVVSLTGTGIQPPVAEAQGSLVFEQDLDRTVARPVQLHNSGAGTLRWTVELKLEAPPLGSTEPEWATATPSSGETPPGETSTIELRADSRRLGIGGVYEGTLAVVTNDPAHERVKWPIAMTVVVRPRLGAPSVADFETVLVTRTATRRLLVRNDGSGTLIIDSLAISGTGYQAALPSVPLLVGSGQGFNIDVSFQPLATCDPCRGEIGIGSNSVSGSPHRIELIGVAVEGPRLEAASDTVDLTGATDLGPIAMASSHALKFVNSGGAPLHLDLRTTNGRRGPAPAPPFSPGVPGEAADGEYTFVDPDGPGAPAFEWVDITAEPPLPGVYDDETIQTGVPLGFSFPFYGQTFDRVNVTSNGYLTFTNTRTHAGGNVVLPDPRSFVPENVIAVFWDDLMTDEPTVYARAEPDRFVVSWIDAHQPPGYMQPFAGPFTFQAILEPSGRILLQYLEMGPGGGEATIGLHDGTKTRGLTVVSDAYYARDGMAIELLPAGESWSMLQHASQTVLPGDTAEVIVSAGASGLADGDYITWVRVGSDDVGRPSFEIPVTLHVGSEAATMALDVAPGFVHPGLVTARVELAGSCAPAGLGLEDVEILGFLGASARSAPRQTPCGGEADFERVDFLGNLDEGDAVPVRLVGRIPGRTWVVAETDLRMWRPALSRPTGSYVPGSSVALTVSGPADGPACHYDLWFSPDAGESWSQVDRHLAPGAYAWNVPRTPTRKGMLEVVAYADSDSAWVGSAFSTLFTVATPTADVVAAAPLPLSFGVVGAHPARGAARFALTLPESRRVAVVVHDVRGARVRRVWDGEVSAGRHERVWDGRTDTGVPAGPGLYFVRMIAGSERRELKVVLTR